MTIAQGGGLAVWGALVGFVCWTALFRLIEPISDWLIPRGKKVNGVDVVVRFVVCVFLIFANLVIIALMPILLKTAAPKADVGSLVWKDAFGVAFVSSLVGFGLFGLLQRAGGDRGDRG